VVAEADGENVSVKGTSVEGVEDDPLFQLGATGGKESDLIAKLEGDHESLGVVNAELLSRMLVQEIEDVGCIMVS
jgi:hypothetical protein